ncbi:unnamed protein product [Adineta ricciae]|uniref:Uncharacterized protein n=1 Tax=Adineta ricciae TaxID=249248 RepID=A0A814KP73_ADIRI|nr:unnamed protein product [Adineta ricciae]
MLVVDADKDGSNSESPTTDSDDDDDDYRIESCSHTHRSCSRHAPCNRLQHQHLSTESSTHVSLSASSKPAKNDIRTIDKQSGHQKKFDGIKWRRICSAPGCTLYLNRGKFFQNWLCRKHYSLKTDDDVSHRSNSAIAEKTTTKVPKPIRRPRKLSIQKASQKEQLHKQNNMRITSEGARQRYDGRYWRPVCGYDECTCFIVRNGYCHRHDIVMRTESGNNPSKSLNIESQTNSQITPSMSNPKKGDVQMVRQLWNGSKWYSLCNYHTRNCMRRARGKKHKYLCDAHYKEYLKKQKDPSLIDHSDQIPISPTVKRKKLIIDEEDPPTNQQHSQSSIVVMKHTEQCIQTDVTYPLESTKLSQGCIFIDDNENYHNQSESCQISAAVKKEDDYIIKKRHTPINVNAYPFDCKIELTKVEI